MKSKKEENGNNAPKSDYENKLEIRQNSR